MKKPAPLTSQDLNCAEPYRTNRILAHHVLWRDYYKQRGDAAIALLIKVKTLVSPYDKACSCSRCDVFNKIDALLGDEQ
jgi:hypothetical protein